MRSNTQRVACALLAVLLLFAAATGNIRYSQIRSGDRQGTGVKFQMAGTIGGSTGDPLCKDANGNSTTSGCTTSVSQSRRICAMILGADNATAVLANADIAPQGRQCFVPYAATVVEVTVAGDAGTPNVVVAKNHAGSLTDLTSSALATASSGGIACSNTGGTTGLDATTTCSSTLTTTSLAAGDYLETHTATAGGTAKRMSIFVTFTVN